MHESEDYHPKKLRSGFTTGSCATATATAAAIVLLKNNYPKSVSVTLPRGQSVEFVLKDVEKLSSQKARASTIKDAGDDPDVTHKARVFCEVELQVTKGVVFYAAEGVGTVTRQGLTIPIGEPAINPVPRKMIEDHLTQVADESGYQGGFKVHVGVENGEYLATKTMNGRLGIVGGLSILGTTGIVRPFSCAAFIASIHQSMEVAHANGIREIAASTGSTSENFIQHHLKLPDMALVEMWDFAGAVLKHLRKVPMEKISICGGFGKMTKLAAGHQSLHSKDASIDFTALGEMASQLGAGLETRNRIEHANTSMEVLEICATENLPIGDEVCRRAREHALNVSRHRCDVDTYSIDRKGNLVGKALA